jgi:hypothetical protein
LGAESFENMGMASISCADQGSPSSETHTVDWVSAEIGQGFAGLIFEAAVLPA